MENLSCLLWWWLSHRFPQSPLVHSHTHTHIWCHFREIRKYLLSFIQTHQIYFPQKLSCRLHPRGSSHKDVESVSHKVFFLVTEDMLPQLHDEWLFMVLSRCGERKKIGRRKSIRFPRLYSSIWFSMVVCNMLETGRTKFTEKNCVCVCVSVSLSVCLCVCVRYPS